MTEPPPPLAAIICTHDRPGYLAACLTGLSAQAKPVPTIVVDSASPPEGAAAIARLTAQHDATLVRLDRPGLSAARNAGMAATDARWVGFLDDDAVPAPDWSAAMHARIAALPDDIAVLGGRILPAWEAPLPDWWPAMWRGILTIVEWDGAGRTGDPALPAGIEPYGANIAYRADALRHEGGFPEELGRIGTHLLSGEEAFVTRSLAARGLGAFYDGAAVVHHSIQAPRLTPQWLLPRVYWQGASDAVVARRLGHGMAARLRALRMMLRNLPRLPSLKEDGASTARMETRCRAQYALGYLRGAYGRAGAVPG